MDAVDVGVWLDYLHFDPPFYAHLAEASGDRSWAMLAIEHVLAYCALSGDREYSFTTTSG